MLAVALLTVPALVAGLAAADAGHGDDEAHGDGGGASQGGGGLILPPVQGTAPRDGTGPAYFSWYQNAWIYGTREVTVLGEQYIRQMSGTEGEWLVWIDARRSDVYAYNVPAGDGFYVTEDSAEQYKPRVSDNVIVWEDRRSGPSHVYAYFLETGETRRLTTGGERANHGSPAIDYPYVAWSSDAGEDWDVVVHDLQTGAELVVSDEGSRDSDPLVVGDMVYWRTYRFNVWDVMWFDMRTGERGSVTSDRKLEAPPFSDGENALFLKQADGGWQLYRFDPVVRRAFRTDVLLSDPTQPAAEGDHLVQARFEASGAGVFAHNLSNGHSAPVSGYLPMTDLPVLMAGKLYAPVWNGSANAILTIALSEYAFRPPPRLVVQTPGDGDLLTGPTRVKGRLTFDDGWGDPAFFGYSVNGANFTRVTAAPQWAFTLDLTDRTPGTYELSVEAHFHDAPPVIETFTLRVPNRVRGIDVEQQAEAYQLALMNYYWHRYIGQNPAVVGLAALALVVVGLWVARWWMSSHAVRRAVVEYVPPEETVDAPTPPDAPPDARAERLRPDRFRTPWSDGDGSDG